MIAGSFSLLFLAAVKHEEHMLGAQFGDAWLNYANSTPRFVPRRLIPATGNWSVQQWRHNREYQAVAAAALGLVGLQAWRNL